MSEAPKDKTTRKIASELINQQFSYQATVYLKSDDAERNKYLADRAKRLIVADNKDKLIFFFISRAVDKETGVDVPYITFYSHERLNGISLARFEEKEPDFCIVGKGRNTLGRFLSKERYEGMIRKLKEGKVHNMSLVAFPAGFKRYGYQNNHLKLAKNT